MTARVAAPMLAVAVAACGAPEKPTAPKTAVTNAISGIATPCGEAHMVLATGGPSAELRRLDAQALPSAKRLAALARRQPQAVYLGTSLATLVRSERSTIAQCHLTRTAARLR